MKFVFVVEGLLLGWIRLVISGACKGWFMGELKAYTKKLTLRIGGGVFAMSLKFCSFNLNLNLFIQLKNVQKILITFSASQ